MCTFTWIFTPNLTIFRKSPVPILRHTTNKEGNKKYIIFGNLLKNILNSCDRVELENYGVIMLNKLPQNPYIEFPKWTGIDELIIEDNKLLSIQIMVQITNLFGKNNKFVDYINDLERKIANIDDINIETKNMTITP